MLFAFHRLNIAPVDTWMEKAVERIMSDYKCDLGVGQRKGGKGDSIVTSKFTPKQKAKVFESKFTPYAGIVQQYMFYYWQFLGKGKK